jgi:hypothetical protein
LEGVLSTRGKLSYFGETDSTVSVDLDEYRLKLALFHHTLHTIVMKVVEKDKVVSGMLMDELKRCQEMLIGLQKPLAGLPKGVLSKRNKHYGDKVYSYYSLKYRDGEKVVNKHISGVEAPILAKKLEQRRKLEKEVSGYKKRIAYLSKILKNDKG